MKIGIMMVAGIKIPGNRRITVTGSNENNFN